MSFEISGISSCSLLTASYFLTGREKSLCKIFFHHTAVHMKRICFMNEHSCKTKPLIAFKYRALYPLCFRKASRQKQLWPLLVTMFCLNNTGVSFSSFFPAFSCGFVVNKILKSPAGKKRLFCIAVIPFKVHKECRWYIETIFNQNCCQSQRHQRCMGCQRPSALSHNTSPITNSKRARHWMIATELFDTRHQ